MTSLIFWSESFLPVTKMYELKYQKSEELNYNHLPLYLFNGQRTKFSQIHMIWDMSLMSLIHSIEKEDVCDMGQEMFLV